MGWWGFIFPVGKLSTLLFLQFRKNPASLIISYLNRRLHASYDCNRRRTGVEVLQSTFLCKIMNIPSHRLKALASDKKYSLVLGTVGSLHYHVARDCRRHRARRDFGQNVLCALSWYGSISEEVQIWEDGGKSYEKGDCVIAHVGELVRYPIRMPSASKVLGKFCTCLPILRRKENQHPIGSMWNRAWTKLIHLYRPHQSFQILKFKDLKLVWWSVYLN